MIFLGSTFLGAKYTALPTPVYSKDEKFIQMQGGLISDMEVIKDVTSSPSPNVTEAWDWDTIIKADYSEGKITAGNTDWTIETVSRVVVKRRVKGKFEWMTIDYRDINTIEDFNFSGVDRFNKANVTYEYALVPYLNENAGSYNVEEIDSEFDAIFIVGADKTYKTFSTNGYIDTTRNISGTYNVPINSRYANYFHSGLMNYDSGSVEGQFYDLDIGCNIIEDKGYEYKEGLMDFLTDYRPKILKHPDGRIWLISIIPSPTDSANGEYRIRNIAFQWIQIGAHDKIEDLYRAGLVDLEEEFWN